jgi:putative hemolysin
MSVAHTVLALAAVAGLALCAFFALAETVVIGVNRAGLRERAERGEPSSMRAERLLADPHALLNVTLVGQTLTLVIVTLALTELLLSGGLARHVAGATLISLCAVAPAAILLASALPKALARGRAERLMGGISYPLTWFWMISLPLEWSIRWVIGASTRLLGVHWRRSPGPISKDQILEFAERYEREGEIKTEERRMIQRILTLHRTRAYEIMQPLIRVVAFRESELTAERLSEIARQTGFSRFPIYRKFIIDLIGHIDIYDALAGPPKTPEEIRALMHPPHYVPETKRVDDLLQEFLRDRRRVAIVIDEHGSCSGWVTLEDILEEIFGEFADEFARERPRWVAEPDGGVVIEAGLDLDDFNAHFGLAIPKVRCDTLGGFIYERLGRVPRVGEAVRHGSRTLRVHEMNAQRIVTIRLEPPEPDAP